MLPATLLQVAGRSKCEIAGQRTGKEPDADDMNHAVDAKAWISAIPTAFLRPAVQPQGMVSAPKMALQMLFTVQHAIH